MLDALDKLLNDSKSGPSAPGGEKEISGEITSTFCATPEFSAGIILSSDYQTVKFSGKFQVNKGDRVILHGNWEEHSKYGWQFKAASFQHDMKMDADGLAHYLGTNPAFVGIGPKKARLIANAFGADFGKFLFENPGQVKFRAKITQAQLKTLQEEWKKREQFNSISSWLGKFGLTHNQVEKLTAKYGDSIKSILESNPYVLHQEVDGYGFYRADQIALKIGTPKDHPGRIQSAILYTVDQRTQDGDCWTEERNLIKLVGGALALDKLNWQDLVAAQLDGLLKAKTPLLTAYQTSDRSLIANTVIYQRELELFGKFTWSAKNLPSEDIENILTLSDDEYDSITGCLTDSQLKAVKTVFNNRITVISGAAGSGKSFTLSTINQLCEETGLSVAMCAPTGKAAKRMEELSGQGAYTIHRLLNYSPQFGWQVNHDNPLEADVLIVDEFSMVDVNLAWHLFDAIDLETTRVVLVGDHNQLPPVGLGNLLRDLLDRKLVPIVILDQVVRQAGILKENCTAILAGKVMPDAPGQVGVLRPWHMRDCHDQELDVLVEIKELILSLLNNPGIDPVRDMQVLAPWKKGLLGVDNLNIELQALIQETRYGVKVDPVPARKRPLLLKRDKVMQIRNDYDLGVMNGAVGFVKDICQGENEKGKPYQVYRIDFDGKPVDVPVKGKKANKLQLAYACTVHKYQGSEVPCAIVIAHSSQSFMLHRNWLYTAVTRARKTTIVMGDEKGVRYAAHRQKVWNRKTFLSVL